VTRLALRSLNEQVSRNEYLPSLVKRLVALYPVEAADRVRSLHEARDAALHDLKALDDPSIARAAADAGRFFDSACRLVWALERSALGLADVIADEALRAGMAFVEARIAAGDGESALAGVTWAFEEYRIRLSFRDEERPYLGWRSEAQSAIWMAGGLTREVLGRVENFLGQLGNAIDETQAQLEAVSAGISGRDYRAFRETVPLAARTVDGTTHVTLFAPLPSLDSIRGAFEILLGWIEQSEPLPTESPRTSFATYASRTPIMFKLPAGWPSVPWEKEQKPT